MKNLVILKILAILVILITWMVLVIPRNLAFLVILENLMNLFVLANLVILGSWSAQKIFIQLQKFTIAQGYLSLSQILY